MGLTLDHFWVGLGSFWITLGSFWHRFGIVLGSLWCPLSNSGSSPCSSFVLAASKRPQAGLVSFVCCGCVFFREILSGTFCCTFFGRLRNSNAIFAQGHNKHFAEQEKKHIPFVCPISSFDGARSKYTKLSPSQKLIAIETQ